jgi:hypothetical protein
VALVSILFSAELVYRERNQIKNAYGDFIIFYTGAQILRDGKGRDLYDLSVQNSYQSKFNVPIRVGPLPYNHPPFELLWHLPLSFLDYYHAYLAWSVVNMILLVLLYRINAPWQDAQLGPMFGLMFLGFYPIVMAFLQGQDSILLTLLLAGAFANLKQKKGTIAGVLFALALIKPQFAIPSVVALVVHPNRTATKTFLGMVSLLIVISLLMVGTSGAVRLIDLLALTDRLNYTITPDIMPNLRGLVYYFLQDLSAAASLAITAFMTLIALWFVIRIWPTHLHDERNFDLRVSLVLTLTVLASYHCYAHDLSLLIIPATLVAKHIFWQSSAWTLNQWLLLCVLVVFWLPFPLTYGPLLAQQRFALGGLAVIGFALLIAVELARTSHQTLAVNNPA